MLLDWDGGRGIECGFPHRTLAAAQDQNLATGFCSRLRFLLGATRGKECLAADTPHKGLAVAPTNEKAFDGSAGP